MNKFIKYFLFLLSISVFCFYIIKYYSIESSFLTYIKTKHDILSNNTISVAQNKPDNEIKNDVNINLDKNISNTTIVNLPCSTYFTALNTILIKFFLKEYLDETIFMLISTNVPEEIQSSINIIHKIFNDHNHDTITSSLVDRIIKIEKIANNKAKLENFLQHFDKIQKYFYSPKFIKTCQYEN